MCPDLKEFKKVLFNPFFLYFPISSPPPPLLFNWVMGVTYKVLVTTPDTMALPAVTVPDTLGNHPTVNNNINH